MIRCPRCKRRVRDLDRHNRVVHPKDPGRLIQVNHYEDGKVEVVKGRDGVMFPSLWAKEIEEE